MPLSVAAFILQGQSDFDALSVFNDELALSFRAMGIEPFIVDLVDWTQGYQTITQVLQSYDPKRIIGAFSFSGFGIDIGDSTVNGNIWEQLKIPMVTWIMDHPGYILKRSTMSNAALCRLYPSMDFSNFQKDYIKAPGRNIHCRMGAFTQGKEAIRREPLKGEIPLIIFAKSVGNPEEVKERWKHLPKQINKIVNDAVDHYWGETARYTNVVASVLTAARAQHLELQNDLPLFGFFIAQLDQYIRMRKANILAKELLRLPVKIYGRNMEHIDTAGSKATILHPIKSRDLMDEYREALAVISMNPNAEDDCHDRVYNALGTGALPISDANPWWSEHFPELRPYTYNFSDTSVASIVEKVLADPVTAADTAWAVGHRVRSERPFKVMAAEAVDWALAQRYFEFDFLSPIDGFVR